MAISFSKFYTGFEKQVSKIIPEPTRSIIGYASLSEDTVLRDDYIYFVKASELNRREMITQYNLLIFEDEKIDSAILKRNIINIISTKSPETYENLITQVKSLFDTHMKLSNLSNQLLLLVQDGATPQKILNFGYQMFGNPLILLDPSLCLIGNAGTDPHIDEPVINYVLSKGHMPERFLKEIMREKSDEFEKNKTFIIWEKDFLKHRLIAGRIVRKNHLIGYLKVFEYNRPFSDSFDVEMLTLFCQYLAISIDSYSLVRYADNPHIESFLSDMLSLKLVDSQAIHERVDLYGMNLHKHKVVIVIKLEEKFANSDKLYLLRQKLQSCLNRNNIVIYGESIVVLYDKDSRDSLSHDCLHRILYSLLDANNGKAAISYSFEDIGKFYKYYSQALACFQISGKLHLQENIYFCEDYVIMHMLLHFSEIFDLNELIHPYVQQLLSIDAQKKSDLTETLFCFIRNKQDTTVAAKQLHVHYNTLKYRISRIEEVTGIDFCDDNIIFRIILSEKIIKLQHNISID